MKAKIGKAILSLVNWRAKACDRRDALLLTNFESVSDGIVYLKCCLENCPDRPYQFFINGVQKSSEDFDPIRPKSSGFGYETVAVSKEALKKVLDCMDCEYVTVSIKDEYSLLWVNGRAAEAISLRAGIAPIIDPEGYE